MAKRSLIEQLDEAVSGILLHPDAALPADAPLTPLARIAAELRDLPRPKFKARLKFELERNKSMATAIEPVTKIRQTATVRLRVKNAAAAIEFYKKAFGARENMRFAREELGVIHAELQFGNAVIMVAEEALEYGLLSPQSLGGTTMGLELFVANSDAAVEQAVAAGASLVSPVTDEFYGYRVGKVADPFGYTWSITTVKEEMSVDEMHRRFNAMMKQGERKKPAVDPVPAGYRTVTPYLVAEDGEGLIDFAKQAFGADEVFRTIGGAGGIHCEVRVGDSMMMIGGGRPGHEFRSKPAPTALHVYVKDADATYQRALAAGATSISPPKDQEYGERGASVKDAFGNHWYIASAFGKNFIPESLHNINVYLLPLRAPAMIDFLKQAFGAREEARFQSPDGVVHHARVKIGDSVVEMGEPQGPYQPMASMFYLYVDDCDALYARAMRAGATSIAEPADQPYGDRSGGVRDPFGNQWFIATHIKDVSPGQ